MPWVTLKFKSASLLWQFKQATKADIVTVDLTACTLQCDCSPEKIKLAIEQYGAVILNEPEQTRHPS